MGTRAPRGWPLSPHRVTGPALGGCMRSRFQVPVLLVLAACAPDADTGGLRADEKREHVACPPGENCHGGGCSWYPDVDTDTWGGSSDVLSGDCTNPPASGYILRGGDCNDLPGNGFIHPAALDDSCDYVDQDCSGVDF